MTPEFTICAMFYGDYPELARRCLDSLRPLIGSRTEFRFGGNDVSEATSRILVQESVAFCARLFVQGANRLKYPVMREMFYGCEEQGKPPIMRTPLVMWFDDDSYLQPLFSIEVDAWLNKLASLLQDHALVGAPYEIPFGGNQREWVADQPWYTQKSTAKRKIKFCTGGWWCARMDVLRQLDYPWKDLVHRGGDTMLGEALYQQGFTRASFRERVRINADARGQESKAPRRGFDSKPIGWDYDRVAATLNRATMTPPAAALRPRKRVLDLDV